MLYCCRVDDETYFRDVKRQVYLEYTLDQVGGRIIDDYISNNHYDIDVYELKTHQ